MCHKKKRVYFLDEYRGLAIILMVIYHAAYNFVVVWGIYLPIFFSPFIVFLRDFFAATFVLLSGICCRFSSNNLKRGFLCFFCGIGVSMVTFIFVPSQTIIFGILHLLGVSMIVFHFLQPLLNRLNIKFGVLFFVVLAVLSWNITKGYIGIGNFSIINVPSFLYQNNWLFPVGIYAKGFYSADYFPLLPWLFIFLVGSYLGIPIVNGNAPKFLYIEGNKFLGKVGKYTLYIYLIHQPIIYLMAQFFNI